MSIEPVSADVEPKGSPTIAGPDARPTPCWPRVAMLSAPLVGLWLAQVIATSSDDPSGSGVKLATSAVVMISLAIMGYAIARLVTLAQSRWHHVFSSQRVLACSILLTLITAALAVSFFILLDPFHRLAASGHIAATDIADAGWMFAARPGQTIVMPVVLRHTLARGDSLSGLAATYYDDPGRGSLLQLFNEVVDPRELSVGQVIEVPLIGVRLTKRRPEPKPEASVAAKLPPPKPAPKAEAKPEPEAEPEPTLPVWFAGDYSVAERAYREGDYAVAHDRLEELIERIEAIAVAEERSRVWQLAAFVEIAFDRGERACSAFESMRSTGTPVELDPNQVSPKIREALEACGLLQEVGGRTTEAAGFALP